MDVKGASTGPGKRWYHASCLLTGPLTNSPGSPLLLVVGGDPAYSAMVVGGVLTSDPDAWVLDLVTHVRSKVHPLSYMYLI